MLITDQPKQLLHYFQHSGIWAYPTEAVYGLGCNPDDETAVEYLLKLKKRPIEKGLILIASDFSQVEKYLKPVNQAQLPFTQPSETTYIFPALTTAPKWLTGNHQSLAIRISKHPVAKAMCEALNSAIVSTSANIAGKEPARSSEEVIKQFGEDHIHAILTGNIGNSAKPSCIRDSISGKIIRS